MAPTFTVICCAIAFFVLVNNGASGVGNSCSFRCQQQPTLLDHMYPSGCYCHSSCGRKFPCCRDKARLCGSGSAGGGQQDCTIPKKIRQATIVGGEKLFYTKGETITYECPYHYEIRGDATRTCYGKNIWTPGPPRCNYVTFVCSPPRIRDGDYSIKRKHYTTGDTISITCNPGYIIQGKSSLRCSLLRWDNFTPSCIRDRCATITHCSSDATCKNFQYYAKCICNEGFEGDGWICKRIPCFKHNCKTNEICVDSGNGDGDYTCECKKGHMRDGISCIADPCYKNDCHADASCSVADKTNRECSCKDGFMGNGTSCKEVPSVFSRVCSAECEGACGNSTTTRACRICIHVQCNGGEVCGEGLSRVPTICTETECYENEGGFDVDTPDNVHCLDEQGLRKENTKCCWVGE